MSVADNMTMASLPWRWRRLDRERRDAEVAATMLRLRAPSLDAAAGELSGGNQQKVVLAKWMLTEPRVLLLDDPTRGIDIGAKFEVYGLLQQWTGQGIGVVLVSRDLPELLALSDRILVLHRGRRSALLSRDEATPQRVMQAAMGAVA
jgi:ABC-type sugar transport system ATPase subunit